MHTHPVVRITYELDGRSVSEPEYKRLALSSNLSAKDCDRCIRLMKFQLWCLFANDKVVTGFILHVDPISRHTYLIIENYSVRIFIKVSDELCVVQNVFFD